MNGLGMRSCSPPLAYAVAQPGDIRGSPAFLRMRLRSLRLARSAPDVTLDEAVPRLDMGVDGNVVVLRDALTFSTVDADHFAVHVEQGAALIAHHQGAIGLDDM